MVNATIRKFGYPATLIAETRHWLILLRPHAVTLGSLILAARHDATAYGDLPDEAFADQRVAIYAIEASLRSFVEYEKINYLMLMMVDPHVHFHVIPRYNGSRTFDGIEYPDAGWPGMPDLTSAGPLAEATTSQIIDKLKASGLNGRLLPGTTG